MRSLEELKNLKEKMDKEIALRESKGVPTIAVHMGTCGIANGAKDILNTLMSELKERNITDINITQTGCPGLCHSEPLMTVTVPGRTPYIYGKVTPESVKKIVAQHIVNNQPVAEFLVNLD